MSRLAEKLSREKALVAKFLGLLERENAALKSRAIDQIEHIAAEKQLVVAQLNDLGKERAALVQLPEDPAAQRQYMQSWFSAHPNESQASSLWEELLASAKNARNLHEANGALVALLLKTTNDALDVLMKPPQEQVLYDSEGQASALTGSRIVDSA